MLRQAMLLPKVTHWLKVQPLKEMHPPHPEAQRGRHLGHSHTGHPRSHRAQSPPRRTSWGVCHTLCLPLSLQLSPPPPLPHIPHRVSQASLPGTSQQAAPKKTCDRGCGSLLGPPERLVRTTPPLLLMMCPVLVHSRTILQDGERSGALPARTLITVELL